MKIIEQFKNPKIKSFLFRFDSELNGLTDILSNFHTETVVVKIDFYL